jgi:phage tail-like protein
VRGSIDGLGTAHPIGQMLPAVFADDDLAQSFTAGLDEVLAPFLNVLDCQDAYFTPALAPVDFTVWLGGWVGAETEEVVARGGGPATATSTEQETSRSSLTASAEERLREAVAVAASLHRLRGTRRGLAAAVRLVFGVEPEISESGGAGWNARPLGQIPGDPRPRLHVQIEIPDPNPLDERRLGDLVAAVRPAHMPYTVQVIAAERTPTGEQ